MALPGISVARRVRPESPRFRDAQPGIHHGSATTAESIRKLRRISVRTTFLPGETIFGEDTPAGDVYLIESGIVSLKMTGQDQRHLVFDYAHANEPVGFDGPDTHFWSAEALTRVDASCCSKAALQTVPETALSAVLRDETWQIASDAWHFQRNLVGQTPVQKVASFLVRLSRRTQTPEGRPISFPVLDGNLADHLRLTSDDLDYAVEQLSLYAAIDVRPETCRILDAATVVGFAIRGALASHF